MRGPGPGPITRSSPAAPHRRSGLAATILDERLCDHCGYNLKGLREDGACPECGKTIARSRRRSSDDSIVDAPLTWLHSLSSGAYILAFAGVIFLCFRVGVWITDGGMHTLCMLGLLGTTLMWWAGVFICTKPRPGGTENSAREWSKLRLVCRLSQAGWACWAATALIAEMLIAKNLTGAATAMNWLGLAFFLSGFAGQFALCLYLSNLADWASDTSLSDHFKSASYLSIAWALAVGFSVTSGLVGLPFAGFLLSSIMFLVTLASVVHFYVGLFQFANMTHWAVINNVNAAATAERLRERAARARLAEEMAHAEAPPPPPPIESASVTPAKWTRPRAEATPIEETDTYALAPDEGDPAPAEPPHRNAETASRPPRPGVPGVGAGPGPRPPSGAIAHPRSAEASPESNLRAEGTPRPVVRPPPPANDHRT